MIWCGRPTICTCTLATRECSASNTMGARFDPLAVCRANATMMVNVVFPILRNATNAYLLHMAYTTADGKIHLPVSLVFTARPWNYSTRPLQVTDSPEYPYPNPPGPSNDTNFDLALFFWACSTLLEAGRPDFTVLPCCLMRYSMQITSSYGIDDPLIPRWRQVVDNLVAWPTDQVQAIVVAKRN